MRGILAVGTALAAVLLAGCGGSGPSYFLMSSTPKGSGLVFADWAAPQNGQASGTLTIVAAGPAVTWDATSPDPQPEKIYSTTQPIIVAITGSKVSMQLRGTNGHSSATLSNGTLTIPKEPPGQPVTWVLHPSDLGAYNQAVARLRRNVAAANVSSDVRKLSTDAGGLAGHVSAIHSAVEQAGADLGTEKSDAAGGSGSDCVASDSVAGDALSVNSDSGTVASAAGTLTTSINSVRTEITNLGDDVATLQRLGGKPADNAHAAASNASTEAAGAVSQANAYISTVNGYLQQAYSLANSLISSSCAGPTLGSPSLVPTIPSS